MTLSVPVLVPVAVHGLPVVVLMLVTVPVVGLAHLCVTSEIKTRLEGSHRKKNQLSVFCYPGLEFDSLHKLLWNKTKPCINSVKVRKRFHTQETPPKLQKRIVYNLYCYIAGVFPATVRLFIG